MPFQFPKEVKSLVKLFFIFIVIAVAAGFFASIGIYAAVKFLRLFGIEAL